MQNLGEKRGIHERLNFLYQSAYEVAFKDLNLSRSYIATMKRLARKSVITISPKVKRTICKSCDHLLIPNYTATIRIASKSRQLHTVITCKLCGYLKRYNVSYLPKYNIE